MSSFSVAGSLLFTKKIYLADRTQFACIGHFPCLQTVSGDNNEHHTMKPANVEELKNWMAEQCLNEFCFAVIDIPKMFQGYALDKKDENYRWFHTDHMGETVLKSSTNEKEVVNFAYDQMVQEKTARLHLIGFHWDREIIDLLIDELSLRNIEYEIDTIEHNEKREFHIRVFIDGRDIKKVKDLENRFIEEDAD
jgi:hypothetical protein